MNVDDIDNNNIVGDEEQDGEKNNDKNDVVSKGKYNLWKKRGRKSMKDINEGRSQSSAINNTVKRKDCIEWTTDLHFIFTKAVKQLGEGRCYPAEILEVMNVPSLTKKQVVSHLQVQPGFYYGDHQDYGLNRHTQNGYNLDINAAHVPTYSVVVISVNPACRTRGICKTIIPLFGDLPSDGFVSLYLGHIHMVEYTFSVTFNLANRTFLPLVFGTFGRNSLKLYPSVDARPIEWPSAILAHRGKGQIPNCLIPVRVRDIGASRQTSRSHPRWKRDTTTSHHRVYSQLAISSGLAR
ncbi:hypothetical protein BC332_24180 [Capsicum chinense]|nr:hypothetical protein BC332_24180 [Capsicum chinense]